VSYNLNEAKEKILVAREAYESLPSAFKKRLVIDSRTELGFAPVGRKGRVSRIVSLPSKAPRGKTGDLVLDELAHYDDQRGVFAGSTAVISRQKGQLTGCSTPLGMRGLFYEIDANVTGRHSKFSRHTIPWWHYEFFCKDVAMAKRDAPDMTTEERVERFATEALIEQNDALTLEEFQQEFEALFVDESTSYYPYELILPCCDESLELYDNIMAVPKPEGRLVAGYDVGRTNDRSALAVFEEIEGHYTCRVLRTYHKVPFDMQEHELRLVLEKLPIAELAIDRTGLGMHMAENLSRDYPQVRGEDFTQPNKERWATQVKILLQKGAIMLPKDRDLVAEFHSVKRTQLASGKISFNAKRTSKGHADRFWAIALACQRQISRQTKRYEPTTIIARIIG